MRRNEFEHIQGLLITQSVFLTTLIEELARKEVIDKEAFMKKLNEEMGNVDEVKLYTER